MDIRRLIACFAALLIAAAAPVFAQMQPDTPLTTPQGPDAPDPAQLGAVRASFSAFLDQSTAAATQASTVFASSAKELKAQYNRQAMSVTADQKSSLQQKLAADYAPMEGQYRKYMDALRQRVAAEKAKALAALGNIKHVSAFLLQDYASAFANLQQSLDMLQAKTLQEARNGIA